MRCQLALGLNPILMENIGPILKNAVLSSRWEVLHWENPIELRSIPAVRFDVHFYRYF